MRKSTVPSRRPHLDQLSTTDRLLSVGAFTGGSGAIEEVLRRFPANGPGTVIVQHVPAGFTDSFAKRLDEQCAVTVREARDREIITPGIAFIAPGNLHLIVQRSGAQWIARMKDGPLVHHQRPAVDVVFQLVAKSAGRNAGGAFLTGMGEDGARGLLAIAMENWQHSPRGGASPSRPFLSAVSRIRRSQSPGDDGRSAGRGKRHRRCLRRESTAQVLVCKPVTSRGDWI